MKVVHINTYQTGGAALCAFRICKALQKEGIDSKMLFAYGSVSEDCDIVQEQSYQWSNNWILRKFQVLLCKFHIWPLYEKLSFKLLKIKKQGGTEFFTLPVSNFKNITEHPWVKDADVVHLHWVANFVDYPSFFKRINKPVVWTLHDENPGLGGFHYEFSKEIETTGLFEELEKECYEIKKRALSVCNSLSLIAITKKMQDFISQNKSLNRFDVYLIHNGVNPDAFEKLDKQQCRKDLSLPIDGKMIFMFSSVNLWDARKGLNVLISALEKIEFKVKPIVLCLGKYIEFPKSGKVDFVCPGLISDYNLLSKYYSSSDFFVMPSYQESFGQTPLESMACGTPVIAFPCGVIPELITDKNGIVCSDYTEESLVESINRGLLRTYDSDLIREDVLFRFSYDIISKKYIDLYKKCITHEIVNHNNQL